MSASPLIALRAVNRSFRMGEVTVNVLRDIDLDIPTGRLTAVLGPSGSGKTTLLNLLGGIDRADSGTITHGGQDLAGLDDAALCRYRRDHVGFIFQFYNLVPTLTAFENVELVRELCDDPLDTDRALELVSLTDRADHFPAQLSGGEQQRVAIARAIAKRPGLLLCDEPTGALDLETGRQILSLLRDLADHRSMAIVLVTHNTAIAPIADCIVRVGSGRIESIRSQSPVSEITEITW